MKRHPTKREFWFLATSLAVVLGLTLLRPETARSQTRTQVDHYRCFNVDSVAGFTPRVVSLKDQFGGSQTAVIRPATFCTAVDKNGEGILDPTAHLTCYTIQDIEVRPGFGTEALTTNQFGSDIVRVGIGRKLCVPTQKEGVPSDLNVDHFKCYEARSTSPAPQNRTVTLQDQFLPLATVVVKNPVNLCTPVDKNEEGIRDPATHLKCYDISNPAVPPLNRRVTVVNQFGTQRMVEKGASVLCVPTSKKVCRAFCDGVCTDTDNDPNNCGACGTTCAAGSACTDGECASLCGNRVLDGDEACDPPGSTCGTNGTCSPDCTCHGPNPECMGAMCGTFTPCNPGTPCALPVCATTAEGGGLCIEGTTSCDGLASCATSADCLSGEICAVQSCCGVPVCIPVPAFCPAPVPVP